MASFEEQVQKAVDAREIPSVVLLACDSKGLIPLPLSLNPILMLTKNHLGKFNYEYCYGPANESSSVHKDSTFILASCTKLMTAISALQCVERGQIALDDDISPILTELKDKEILVGFKEGTEEPIFKKAEKKITLKYVISNASESAVRKEKYSNIFLFQTSTNPHLWMRLRSIPSSSRALAGKPRTCP